MKHGILGAMLEEVEAIKNLSYTHNKQTTLAVEMEGAAVAQVCHEHGIPYLVIRTISDKANHSAAVDFQSFITTIASHYSAGILQAYFYALAKSIPSIKPDVFEKSFN
jgi:nucleoside phosphorylase